MNSKFSILVNSCDNYSDAWPIFFYLLEKQWTSEYPKIYLNTETKQYTNDILNLKVLNSLSKESTNDWGSRLLSCLNRIGSDYILMMLEDFFYEEKIDVSAIYKSVKLLEEHGEIAAVQFFYNNNRKSIETDELYGFVKRSRFEPFIISAGPSMWRKQDLIALTKGTDSPWTWEYFGSCRTYFYGKHFYCLSSNDPLVFKYDVEHGGAIHRGKWVGYKMRELENKFNFSIDYGDREIEEDWMKDSDFIKPPLPIYKRWRTVIQNRLKIATNTLYGLSLRRMRNIK